MQAMTAANPVEFEEADVVDESPRAAGPAWRTGPMPMWADRRRRMPAPTKAMGLRPERRAGLNEEERRRRRR